MGLTQREFAFLLGVDNGAQVSRYERHHHLPPLRTALACAVVLGVDVEELFAGIRAQVDTEVDARLQILKARLTAASGHVQRRSATGLDNRKLARLEEIRPQPIEPSPC